MVEEDIVPSRLKNPINFKIFVVIIAAVIGFHSLVNFTENSGELIYAFSIIIPGIVAVFSFITAKKYSGTLVYFKAYVALGIGFLGIFLGEVTYLIYEQILELDPYPSIADVFFFLFYLMISIYLIFNIRFFAPKTQLWEKIIVGIIPVAITLVYLLLTISEELSFDFYYGMVFVIATSIALGLAVYAARIFKEGLLGTAWLILVIGILMLVGGDIWYYYIELFEGYSLDHIVNLFWYGGYLVILYALYKHKSSL